MPITTRSAARVNTEESNRDDMGDREEQENTCSATSDDNLVELFAMMRQQTELMLEHKVAQTTQMNEIQRLIGDIDEKIQRISKRQDRLETRLDRVDTDAPPTLRDVLARDQFIDALSDEDTRLRIKQERPRTLQKSLEAALELESFQIAARQRVKVSRETELLRSAPDTDQNETGKFNQLEEGKLEMMKILERLESQ